MGISNFFYCIADVANYVDMYYSIIHIKNAVIYPKYLTILKYHYITFSQKLTKWELRIYNLHQKVVFLIKKKGSNFQTLFISFLAVLSQFWEFSFWVFSNFFFRSTFIYLGSFSFFIKSLHDNFSHILWHDVLLIIHDTYLD